MDGCVTKFVEVVRQNLGRKSYSDALYTLRQQQRKLYREGNRLFIASVVAILPFRCFRIEYHFFSEWREAGLNVTASCSIITCKDIAPVALRIHQELFLSQTHQGILDAGVTMWVELHGVTHDVGHLIVTPILHAPHAVQHTALHGFQSVHDVRHCTFQNHIAGIIQEPVLIHAAQLVLHLCVLRISRSVVRVSRFLLLFVFQDIIVFSAHIRYV